MARHCCCRRAITQFAAGSIIGSKANDLRPNVVGEFDDNALLNTFGRSGLGLFPAPSALALDVEQQFGAVPVGELSQVREQFYAISNERKIKHPAVEAILSAIPG